jgi:phage gp36-like protein
VSDPYTTTAAIEAKIPGAILDDALDDNGDGQRDDGLLTTIIANATDAVDAMLCNRITLPLATVPASVKNAALWFAVEEIYGRRQAELPKNFAAAIKEARAWLEAIRSGRQQLDASVEITLVAGGGGQPAVPGRVPIPGSDTTY